MHSSPPSASLPRISSGVSEAPLVVYTGTDKNEVGVDEGKDKEKNCEPHINHNYRFIKAINMVVNEDYRLWNQWQATLKPMPYT